ncbi:MAG TPA: hypothetical protein VGY48_12485 [Vicinamibacterales bacterium]|jgi:hypothetical protein|nr:hypothetical protein [Vicinamibacterales bacterium]
MFELIGKLGAIGWLLGFMAILVFGGCWPFLVWSVVRNIKRIRLQLERLNTNLESGGMNIKLTLEQTGAGLAGGSTTRAGAGPLKL